MSKMSFFEKGLIITPTYCLHSMYFYVFVPVCKYDFRISRWFQMITDNVELV